MYANGRAESNDERDTKQEDFSAGTRRVHKLLMDKKKELAPNVKKANLRHRKLVVTETVVSKRPLWSMTKTRV